MWPTSIFINQCADHIEPRLNGYSGICYETAGWYFGDGDSITFGNLTYPIDHDYLTNGTYNVCVKLKDPANIMNPQTICKTISVTNAKQCNANFNYSFVSDSLFLTNSSIGNNQYSMSAWGVNIDSTQGLDSFQENPHFYLTGGTGSYKVCLTIQNNDCSCYDDTCIVVNKNVNTFDESTIVANETIHDISASGKGLYRYQLKNNQQIIKTGKIVIE